MRITKYSVAFVCVCSVLLFCGEQEAIKRVISHLSIRDYHTALEECRVALTTYPKSEKLKRVHIQALIHNKKIDEAISFWKESELRECPENFELLEMLAWGVLNGAEHSPQLIVNQSSLINAFSTNDVRAVEILINQLRSTNSTTRAMAAQLSSRYRDEALVEELKHLLKVEKVWFVRLEVIRALGAMEIRDIEDSLTHIICQSRTTAEEKAAAIAALVLIYEDIDDHALLALIESGRAGLRYLACQIITHLDLKRFSVAIIKLLDDPCVDVRIATLNTLYFLGLSNLNSLHLNKVVDLASDSYPAVALTASWIISQFAPDIALKVVSKHIYSTDDQSRRLAALILGRIGGADSLLKKEVVQIALDPYVKANLALGMICQGGGLSDAVEQLYTFIVMNRENVMWERSENPLFELLSPSKVYHIPYVPQYPTMVDHLTRLKILEKLSILKHPRAEEAIKSFLTRNVLGVPYQAATLLFQEGGEDVVDIVNNLMNEHDESIRIQAALVLAFWGEESKAVNLLHSHYHTANQEMKIHILRALGYIGHRDSIPFLVNLLEEPYQILKVVAATALIQCAYH